MSTDMNRTPILDETIIAEAKQMMQAKFSIMAQYYFEDSDGYIAAIRDSIAHQRMDEVVSPAHTLKSSSRQMGALRVSELAKQIEHLARDHANSNVARLAPLVSELEVAFAETKRAFVPHQS